MPISKLRQALSESAKHANSMLRLNPENLSIQQVYEIYKQLGPCIVAHDKDPAHILTDKGYWQKLTPAAAKRSTALSWLVYSFSTCIRRHEDPDWKPAGYTGRKSNR